MKPSLRICGSSSRARQWAALRLRAVVAGRCSTACWKVRSLASLVAMGAAGAALRLWHLTQHSISVPNMSAGSDELRLSGAELEALRKELAEQEMLLRAYQVCLHYPLLIHGPFSS